jgi:hypothetical protein
MIANFDIFMRLPDGQPVWIKAVDTLGEAEHQLAEISAKCPGEYFIFNAGNGQVLAEMQSQLYLHERP